jgi:Zn-dependent M28 family amino/carboxypeptidase
VRNCANILHTGVLAAVVIAGGDNVAVEVATDLLSIFHDGGLGAYLNASVFNDLNAVNDLNFF